MDERFYYLGFSAFSGVGPVRFNNLLKRFGTAKDAWNAKNVKLKEVLGDVLSVKFEEFKNEFSIESYAKQLKDKKVSFFTLSDKEYPKLLKEIKNPPFVLYVKGEIGLMTHFVNDAQRALNKDPRDFPSSLNERRSSKSKNNSEINLGSTFSSFKNDHQTRESIEDSKTIAVVGTRKITEYGREVTKSLTQDLVNAGFTIVSGLAFGVDAVAHQTAIDCGGKTIAVLGSGVDLCFPSSNLSLYNSIINGNGAVVSQFPLGEQPTQGSFPSRNRIIAGLSEAVLVTEGAEDSGALITADYVFSSNRKVFAVPGPITSNLSKGPYKLINRGAKLVTRVEDILKEFSISNFPCLPARQESSMKSKSSNYKTETKEEQVIVDLLANEALHFDQIVRVLKLDSAKVGSILSMMEIKGLLKSSSDGIFSIIH